MNARLTLTFRFSPAAIALAAALAFFPLTGGDAAARKPVYVRAKAASISVSSAKTEPPPPTRAELLATDTDRLRRVGRHIVVGYQNVAAITALAEAGAISGLLLTVDNVRNRSVASVRAEIDTLQAARMRAGLPALIIAADQEGGFVSRLSPPLKRQPGLGGIIAAAKTEDERRRAVQAYAREQALELKEIGVTLNLAPVVDLRSALDNRDDGETQLRYRALSADPELVSQAASWYCGALEAAGVLCTLKHFPGLGRVARDTHAAVGEIKAAPARLALTDWMPFRRAMSNTNAAVMVGHVKVPDIDGMRPASSSRAVMTTLIREAWKFDGLLITDDFGMGAVTRSPGGAGASATAALNGGADLILVSYAERYLDPVLATLIEADRRGTLDRAMLDASEARLSRVVQARSAQSAP